jgi:vacuolar-type H+-ATPase subunit D/Vma8
VTSQRKLKKRAEAQGMTGPELRLVEMLQEMLADMRWMQILAYTNQYLLSQKLSVTDAERDQILEAATRAVDKDSKMHEWNDRLARLKAEIAKIKRQVGSALAPSDGEETGQMGAADG